MRPLAVLLLVLGALASLAFAILSLTGSGGRNPGVLNVVRPVHAAPRDVDATIAPPREALALTNPTERTAVVEVERVEGAHTGLIRGTVVALDGAAIKDASISLIRRAGGVSSLIATLQMADEGAPAFPERTTKSDASGQFRFASLEPSGEWLMIVTHDDFAKVEVGPIDVPERGGIDERIVLRSGLVLHGRILAAGSRMPIEGARVTIDSPLASMLPSSRKSRARQEVTTDKNGQYAFANIGAGQRTLKIAAKGFATRFISNFGNEIRAEINEARRPKTFTNNLNKQMAAIEAAPNQPLQKDYELELGQRIAGRVLGPDLSAIENIQVSAVNQSGSAGSRGDAISVAGGEFVIEDLGEGVYTLFAEAPGYEMTTMQRIDVGRTDVEIVLPRQGSVAGTVVDAETGKPVPNFTVKVRTLNPRNLSWGGMVGKKTVRNQKDGAFKVEGISAREYVIEGHSKGYASSFSEPFRVDQGIPTHNIEVRLTKGGTIKGIVLDGYTGEPIAGATIETKENNFVDTEIMYLLGSVGSTATTLVKTTTDEKGEYLLELLTPDVYQIRIEKRGFTPLIINDVKAGDGSITEMGRFQLRKGAVVRGVVYGADGETIPGANVVMRSNDGNSFATYDGRTDANGAYTLRNAQAGVYKLSASRPPTPNSNPFMAVVDINNSEVEISIVDGGEHVQDLSLARSGRDRPMKVQ